MTDKKNDINLVVDVQKESLFKKLIKFIILIAIAVFIYNWVTSEGVYYQEEGLIIKNYNDNYKDFQKEMVDFKRREELSKVNISSDVNKNKKSKYIYVDDKDIKSNGKNIYYLGFSGDVLASQVDSLRKEVDAVLGFYKEGDEVLLNLDSPGGSVTGYGLVASQLKRIKDANIPFTVVVDQVAASGGYMAAVVADKIYAAPFAMVGSIGVVANVPIVEDLLGKIGVDYRVYTAGESKRTVTTYKKPTNAQEDFFNLQLKSIHDQFKNHVLTHRPDIDINKVATGNFFSGDTALKMGLIDGLSTSDEYLRNKYTEGYEILSINYKQSQDNTSGFINATVKMLVKELKNELFKANAQSFIY